LFSNYPLMNLPKNWNEINIGQFQQINTALKNYPDNAITQAVWMLNAFTGKTREELLAMDFNKDFKPLMKQLDWINVTPLPTQLPKQFEVDGEEYTLVYDMKQRTTGQFVDLAHFTTEPENIIPNLHQILAVLCVPTGQKNHADGFEQRAKLFKEKLSIAVAYPIATFFLRLWLDSLPHILTYLEKQAKPAKKNLWTRITGLLPAMAGWQPLMRWRKTARSGIFS
jgi:hypothetical protein